MTVKYLFIDRDGTLINEPKINLQVDCISKLSFEFRVVQSLSILKDHGYKFIIVSNQDGLGTKKFPEKKFYIPHNLMLDFFSSQDIYFEEIFICRHYYHENCFCRKPKLGLVENFLKNNLIDKKNSYVIGDRVTDIEFGKNLGIKAILYNKDSYNWPLIVSKIIKRKRYIKVIRNTLETNVFIELWLDKNNNFNNHINTGIDFFDHMLEQISFHGGFNMNVIAISNLYIDDHHIIEDVAIVLGSALLKILGNKIGLKRFGFILPMDDSLAQCVLDISGRSYLSFKVMFNYQYIKNLSTEMIKHFFKSISDSMKINIHIKAQGENDHHLAESIFKVFGKSLMQAIELKGNFLPTSKGIF